MKKVLAILVVLLIGGFVYYSLNYADNGEVDYTDVSDEYNEKLRDLKIQREALQAELSQYEDDYSIPNLGSVIFLLSDIDKTHLDEAIPQLEANGYIGVIAISPSNMPDNDGSKNMTRSQINDLVEKGYEVVIRLEQDEDVNEAYNKFIEDGYVVRGFYLPGDKIGLGTIDAINKIGGMAMIGNFEDFEDEDALVVNSYGNKYSNVKNKFFDSIKESNTIAITIGYGDDSDEEYEYVNFTTMLNIINPYVDDSNTDVCNITDARRRYDNYLDQLDNIQSDDRDKVKELKKQIAEIDEQMILGEE